MAGSRSLGTLTIDLIAKVGGFEQGMDAAAKAADKKSREIEQRLEGMMTRANVLGNLIGQGLSAGFQMAVEKIPALINALDKLDEMAEKSGNATESLSALRYAGEVAGTNFEQLGTGLSKLARLMSEAAGGNEKAISTFQALGVEFSNTDGTLRNTDDVLKDVAQRFSGYRDGAAKSAYAVRVFGKAGEDMIPILNLGASGISRLRTEAEKLGAIYSGDVAGAAAQFNDNMTKVRLASEAASIGLASGLIKTLADLSDKFIEAKKNGGLFEAGMASYSAGVKAFWNGTFFSGESQKAVRSIEEIQAYVNKLGGLPAGGGRGFVNPKIEAPMDSDPPKAGRVRMPKDTGAQEAAARLAADLDAIKNAQTSLVGTYSNQQRILDALRGAGLQDERSYYEERIKLQNLTTSAQADALRQEIARLQQEQLTGKAAIDNSKKIADAQSQLAKVQADGATSVKVLGIESEAAYKKSEAAILSARQAAQDFYDTNAQGFARQLEGIGMGAQFREQMAGLQQIEETYQRQRQNLQNLRAQAELSGTFTPEAQKRFAAELAIINEFADKSTKLYRERSAQIEEAARSGLKGATEALNNYANEAAKVGKQVDDALSGAFKRLEDTIVDVLTTGKADFKAFADSIIKDMVRIIVRTQITGPLAEWSKGLFKGGGGGQGFDWSKAAGFISGLFGGGKASGGPVAPNTMYRVNENGPELFQAANGDQFLMTGTQSGNIVPNNALGGGGGMGDWTIINHSGVPFTKETMTVNPRERALIIRDARRSVAADWADPNSQQSRAYARNYRAQRKR